MPFKLNRYHRNYLFWIYPMIFAGLTFYAIRKDNLDIESGSKTEKHFGIDSSLFRSAKSVLPENLTPTESIDTAMIYYDAK